MGNQQSIHKKFVEYCKNGNLDEIHYIYLEHPQLDISANSEEAFRLACNSGEIYVIRQLYEWRRSDIDIRANDYESMRRAVINSHKEVMIQLFQWFSDQINPADYYQFATTMETRLVLNYLDRVKQVSQNYRQSIQWIDKSWLFHYIGNAQGECSICLEGLDDPVKTPCAHIYCRGCILECLNTSETCPYCRAKI